MLEKDNRRKFRIRIYVSSYDFEIIRQRQKVSECRTMGQYGRIMLLQGKIYRVEIPELIESKEKIRQISDNINAIAKMTNQTGYLYANNIRYLSASYHVLSELFQKIEKHFSWMRKYSLSKKRHYTGKQSLSIPTYVTQKEKLQIENRKNLSGLKTLSRYGTEMLKYGFLIDYRLSEFKENRYLIRKISVNINQIVKDSPKKNIFSGDLDYLALQYQKLLHQITEWRQLLFSVHNYLRI